MARRRARKPTRRRRKQGISLLGVAETVALSNVATQTLFNVNAYDFLMGGSNFQGANAITLRELFNPTQATGQRMATYQGGKITGSTPIMANTTSLIQQNLQANWMTGAIGMVTIPLAFKFGKQIARPAISRVNRLLSKAGVSSTVKV